LEGLLWPMGEKPGREGRADQQYIPSRAMHGINGDWTLLSVQKVTHRNGYPAGVALGAFCAEPLSVGNPDPDHGDH
jgi:hypothetical protein